MHGPGQREVSEDVEGEREMGGREVEGERAGGKANGRGGKRAEGRVVELGGEKGEVEGGLHC